MKDKIFWIIIFLGFLLNFLIIPPEIREHVIVLIIIIAFAKLVDDAEKKRKQKEKYEKEKLKNVISTKILGYGNSEYITNSDTKTNFGSIAGRSIVGGVLFGPVGAIVGGSTAKKKTKSKTIEVQSKERVFIVEYSDGTIEEDIAKKGTEKYRVYMSKLKM